MNLIIDRSNRLAHDNCWEWKYVMDIFRQVEKKNLNQYQFILTDNLECLPIVPTKNTVVLIISDEKYIIPKYTHEVKAIFKNYAYPDQESLNIYAYFYHFCNREISTQ